MNQSVTTVSTDVFCWILQRSDGAGFAATSSDQSQAVGALTLEPNVDLQPSDLAISNRMFGSTLGLDGGLSSLAITRHDLLAGRWNDASVQLLVGDWRSGDDLVPICSGGLDQVRGDGERLAMSVDILPRALREPPCIQTSPECRAILGDAQCRIDMRSRRRRVVITGVDGMNCTIKDDDTDRFVLGRLRWITGRNCGIENIIIAAASSELRLQGAAGLEIRAGDQAILTEGCDGLRATCVERFANIENFRGEPDLPGSEILLRYPGA